MRAHARIRVEVFTNTSQRIPLMASWIGSQIVPEDQVLKAQGPVQQCSDSEWALWTKTGS